MKKITFVQRDDDSSYDPVSTFFGKKKAPSVPKPSVNASRQTAFSSKTPIQKAIQAKTHQKTHMQQAQDSIAQKIGQKGGSGYIPKKVPNFNSTSYDKLKEQTIYDLKQKQKEFAQNTRSIQQRNNSINNSKKNTIAQKKPDMVFDVPLVDYGQEDENEAYEQKIDLKDKKIDLNEKKIERQAVLDAYHENSKKLPQIRSPPATNVKQIKKQQQRQPTSTKKSVQTGTKPKPPFIQQKPSSENKPSSQQKLVSSKQLTTNQPPLPSSSKQSSKIEPSGQNPLPQQKTLGNNSLQQRVRELQSFEKQYISKIDHLQQRIQALSKTQQRYNKLTKQHKQCQQKLKDATNLTQQLSQAQQSIKLLMSQPTTPYNKKREYLLLNQLNQLKRTNRQLTLRIKSYKGTDLVEMAIARNKEEIGREFEIQYEEEKTKMNAQMESSLAQLIGNLYEFLEIKTGKNSKLKKEEFTVEKEQRILMELNALAEKLSLTYLEKYEVSPLPKCNQDCVNLYAQIEKEKQNIFNQFTSFDKIATNEDLNFAITQTNLQIVNDTMENSQQMQSLQQIITSVVTKPQPHQKQRPQTRPGTSYGQQKQTKDHLKSELKKFKCFMQIFKRRASISSAFHIQSICYFTFLRQFVEGKLKRLQSQLVNLYGRLKQMKDIYDLGGNTAKESLFLYLETNLENFCFLVPNLNCRIKEIKSSYRQISKGLSRKMKIESGY